MEEKMKKMLFLMLFLLILGAANVTSQVRIGGNGVPNGAAVLDLNATDAINNGTKGLALPRVSLTNVNTALVGSPTVNGMIVYNTNASVIGGSGVGIYYWVTNKWVKMLNSDFVEGDGIVGNEVAGAIAGGGLRRYGDGTAVSPYTLGLDTAMVTTGSVMRYAGGTWAPAPFLRGRIATTGGGCVVQSGGSCYTAFKNPGCNRHTMSLHALGPDAIDQGSVIMPQWSVSQDSVRVVLYHMRGPGGVSGWIWFTCFADSLV